MYSAEIVVESPNKQLRRDSSSQVLRRNKLEMACLSSNRNTTPLAEGMTEDVDPRTR